MNNEETRILKLKNYLMKKDSRITLEKVTSNYMKDAVKLALEVFGNEQNIPENLIPIKEDLKPVWWCARVGQDVIGTAACWREEDEWHWGRFAVDKRLRGIGIGKKLAVFSLNEVFNLGAEKIFIGARDITVIMLTKLGRKVVGQPFDFYGEPVTPITIEKCDFEKKR